MSTKIIKPTKLKKLDTTSLPSLKIAILGDTNVGKTSMLSYWIRGSHRDIECPTIGVEFSTVYVSQEGSKKAQRLSFWDTGGQERFRALINSYYRDCAAIVLVYDVTSRKTFENIDYWITEVTSRYMESNMPIIILVGNKTDLDAREVSTVEGKLKAGDHNAFFVETSVHTGYGVTAAWDILIEHLYAKNATMYVWERAKADLRSYGARQCCF